MVAKLEDEGGKEPQESKATNSGSWLDVATVMINKHLQAFRMLPWVIGGGGALLIIRYSRMFTRYRKAADIPPHLISQAATLRGVAVGAWPYGHLDVWHTPPGRRWLYWKTTPPKAYSKDQVLGVRLAAVAIQQPEAVHSWMTSNLIGRSLRLQLLHHSTPDDCLHCIVKYRRQLFRSLSCANTELISLGLATLEELSHNCHANESSQGNEALITFLSEGVKAETGAQRRGEGVWKGSIHETRWRGVARALKLRN